MIRLTLDFPDESFARVSMAYGREFGLFDESGNRIGATKEQLMAYFIGVIDNRVQAHEAESFAEQERAAREADAAAAAAAAANQPDLGLIPGGEVL